MAIAVICNYNTKQKHTSMTSTEKPVIVVGVDDTEASFYALEWTLDHFFAPSAPNPPFDLYIVQSKPVASSTGVAFPAVDMLSHVDKDLKNIAAQVIERARELCISKSVNDATLETVEGDAGNVLCDAVERHQATILAVGGHGYGKIKRAVLGSVSDYVAHHAHCTVMIVKKPKAKPESADH